jgi:PPK2 family polyphosphate:nucleotide phosphotransferase
MPASAGYIRNGWVGRRIFARSATVVPAVGFIPTASSPRGSDPHGPVLIRDLHPHTFTRRPMSLHPIEPGAHVSLGDKDAAAPDGLPTGSELDAELEKLGARMDELATALHAEEKRALLVVIQARDAGGKDGTVRKVFRAISPQFLQVTEFGRPTAEELSHDFLWRVHGKVPAYGHVGVFTRSHYEDVLVVRVRDLAPKKVWAARYGQINDFERMLGENGVTLLKLFLHVSRDEQVRRFRKRLDKPDKRWKFDPGDLDDRALWDDYTDAYRDVFARCSTEQAPWYVVPADDKDARNLLVARLVVKTLERMDPKFPAPDFDVEALEKRIGEG